jgi:hypothetical protein
MQPALDRASLGLARELNALVAPVGRAWQLARERDPQLPLYDDDGSHPAVLGTYAAAYVFHALVYDTPPPTHPPRHLGSLPLAAARVVQETAWEAVRTVK